MPDSLVEDSQRYLDIANDNRMGLTIIQKEIDSRDEDYLAINYTAQDRLLLYTVVALGPIINRKARDCLSKLHLENLRA